jgi:S-(hydroxymethyl)glutathione dehydrogenase/alcohol dehydrogenase
VGEEEVSQECENCLSGKTNLCLRYPVPFNGLMRDDTSRMSIRGFYLLTWCEYMAVDVDYILRLHLMWIFHWIWGCMEGS